MQSRSNPMILARGLGVDHLWLITILCGFVAFVSLIPLVPNDFWWHLKIGEMIYQTGIIPNSNIFSWTLSSGYPYFYGAWLGELLLYAIYDLGGLSLIVFIRNLLALLTFLLISIETYRKCKSWRMAGLLMIPTCAMASSNLIVRPQMWTWILFALFYLILNRYIDGELRPGWLLICPILMALWTNIHGSYVLGIAMIVIYFIGELLKLISGQPNALSRKELIFLSVICGLTLGATIVNPKFLGILDYVINMLTNQPSQQLGTEWQSPVPGDFAMIIFFLSILIVFIVFTYSQYKPDWTKLFLNVSFLWLAITGVRYVIWFGMIIAPILAISVNEMLQGKSWLLIPHRNPLNAVLALIICIPVLMIQPWFISQFTILQQSMKNMFFDKEEGVILTNTTPIGATEYLRQHPGKKLFNDMAYGSYLIWKIPDQKVFVDPRIDLYPYQTWIDYKKIVSGIRSLDLLQQYGATRVFLDRTEEPELVKSLEKNPGWILEYEDEQSQIWSKMDSEK